MARRRTIDNAAVVVNAVGITDAFGMCRLEDPRGDARYQALLESGDGWLGLAMVLADAARWLEEWRFKAVPDGEAWGAGWPPLYDIWDAVADALWHNLYTGPTIAAIVEGGIQAAIEKEKAHGNA